MKMFTTMNYLGSLH